MGSVSDGGWGVELSSRDRCYLSICLSGDYNGEAKNGR